MAKVDLPSPILLQERDRSQTLAVVAGHVLVVLMMMTFAMGVVYLGGRLVPTWRGGYLVWLSLVLSLEAIYTRKRARLLEGREKAFFRISEWIAIAVAIKILLYLINDPAQLLEDLPRWQENFVENFFTAEYVLALVLSLGFWLVTVAYSGELEDLHEREKDAEWDELGKLQNALKDIRGRISSRIFIIGTLLVIMAVASRIDASAIFRARGAPPPGYQAPVANVLVYFILGLVMLSLTQFALMRTRWLSQRLAVSPGLAKNWIRYGLAFFAVLAVVVFFLPTEYSLGLLDTLRYSLDFLIRAVAFLFTLILLPLTWCLSLFRFSQSEVSESQPAAPFSPPPVAGQPGQPLPWLEVVRSLAFWIIFIGVIAFALRYYLMQNSALWQTIRAFPLVRWLAGALSGLWSWLKGANRQLGSLVRSGIKRLRPKNVRLPGLAIRRMLNPARLDPREKIIFYYLNLIHLGGERGLDRRPAQTPYQYEVRLVDAMPDVGQELRELTGSFVEARYSRHPVEEPHAAQAASLWERIKAILRSWTKPDA
jgi:hypothetical protein